MTNNPRKIEQLTHHRVVVSSRIPHVVPPNDQSRFYHRTKAIRSGRCIDSNGRARIPEQSDPVLVEGMAE